jgi:hypothetical protein
MEVTAARNPPASRGLVPVRWALLRRRDCHAVAVIDALDDLLSNVVPNRCFNSVHDDRGNIRIVLSKDEAANQRDDAPLIQSSESRAGLLGEVASSATRQATLQMPKAGLRSEDRTQNRLAICAVRSSICTP